jgi:hypothetical protein
MAMHTLVQLQSVRSYRRQRLVEHLRLQQHYELLSELGTQHSFPCSYASLKQVITPAEDMKHALLVESVLLCTIRVAAIKACEQRSDDRLFSPEGSAHAMIKTSNHNLLLME